MVLTLDMGMALALALALPRETVMAVVLAMELALEMTLEMEDNVESVEWHCLIVKTNKESYSTMWRNDSNGYYGGTANIFLNCNPIGNHNFLD